MTITEMTVPLQELAWLPWAVQYFFFIGISTTAAMLAATADLGGGERWRRIQPAAMLLALSVTVVAPIALLADLHQPGRFWLFYTHITPSSWMSIGAVLLPLYIGSFLAYVAVWLRERVRHDNSPGWLGWLAAGRWSGRRVLPWLAALTVLNAFGILLYTGSEVMIVEARALWHTGWLPINLALTALLASVSAIAFLQRWVTGAAPRDTRFVLQLMLASLLLTALGAGGWALSGWLFDGVSFNEALRLVEAFGYWQLLFVGSSVVGVLLVAATLVMLNRPQAMHNAWLLAPVALLAAWSFRWAVLMDVQTVPKYGAGLYPYELPLGSDGLLGMLGTFGLWTAVLIGLISLVAWGVNTDNAGNAREASTHG